MKSSDNNSASEVGNGSEEITLEAKLADDAAGRQIDNAVTGRKGVVRKYVRWLRRCNPDATPMEVITTLGHHYISAISAAGAAIVVGGIAAEVGISLIPGGGAAATGAKAIAKKAALGVAKTGAKQATKLLPAGEEQLQFEITALYALAIADIYGIELDRQQAHALVYGLTNGQISQQQIAVLATELTKPSGSDSIDSEPKHVCDRKELSQWTDTLAESLPSGATQNLAYGLGSGVIDVIQSDLSEKQQTVAELGIGAVAGGVTRFVFGREVVEAARSAFAEAPEAFPEYLDLPDKPGSGEGASDQALLALEEAAKTVGVCVSTGSTVVVASVTAAAGEVSRPFCSVDLDGDGVLDEPQALTVAKGFGGSIMGAAKTARGAVLASFRRKK